MTQEIEIDNDIIEVELEPQVYADEYTPGDIVAMGRVHYAYTEYIVEGFEWEKALFTQEQNQTIADYIKAHYNYLSKIAVDEIHRAHRENDNY